MSKYTMNQLMTMQVSLVALSQIKLPAHPAAYRIGRALDTIASASKQPIADMQALYQMHGVLNAGGTQFAPPTDPEALAAFQAAWTEIQNREIEIELRPIRVSDLGDGPIEPSHLMVLNGVMILDDVTPAPVLVTRCEDIAQVRAEILADPADPAAAE